ncbi:MAG: hypothetical protein CL930_05015 [Deltaproteobacteria bacterium]|nr:hypothetical protein [Deltaproteobacteria bacterium]
MFNLRLGLATMLLTTAGCDHNLDSIDGHVLGNPESVVFSRNDSDHIMIVMSDLPDLCDALSSADLPHADDFWVVSAWTHVGVNDPGDYAVEAFAAVSRNAGIDEYDTEAGGIKFNRIGADLIKAKVDVTFPGNDRLKAKVKAEYCDSDLFLGMY